MHVSGFAQLMKRAMAAGIGVAMAAAVTLSGCSGHAEKSFTFDVDTGDKVKVTLDLASEMDIRPDGSRFVVTKNGNNVVSGSFDEAARFDEFKEASDSGNFEGDVVPSDDENVFAWTLNDGGNTERDRVMKVSDSTCVIMGSIASEEDAGKAYDSLSFSVE